MRAGFTLRVARWRRFLRQSGPGIISGAANDDPSCIVTYAIAGASLGLATLWTSLYLLPLLAAVQLICSRLGMVSGQGLAAAIRARFPGWFLALVCVLLACANVLEIAADLGGMGEVTAGLTGVSASFWTPVYAVGIAVLVAVLWFGQIVRVFKWLCLALFAYVAAALMSGPDWHQVLWRSVVPAWNSSPLYAATLTAIVGASFSPYFLFWQVQTEAEHAAAGTAGARRAGLRRASADTVAGAIFSKLITYCITLTTAAALFAHGRLGIQTAGEAAGGLAPFAGRAAAALFAVGLIGTGLLGVPALAGSAAYAIAEAASWRAGLLEPPDSAARFYLVLGGALAVGLALFYAGFRVVDLLFWASILNGVLAPVIIVCVLVLARDAQWMGRLRPRRRTTALAWLALSASVLAAAGMLARYV